MLNCFCSLAADSASRPANQVVRHPSPPLPSNLSNILCSLQLHVAGLPRTDMYEVPDAVPPIHAVSSHVATDKDPSK